jgi:hypothetical protein
VQLSHRFTLDDLAAQVPYFARLGISHMYLSPIYAARPQSPHGYDIVDYALYPELEAGRPGCGSARHYRFWIRRHCSMSYRIHMAADPMHNALWRQC